MITVENIRTCKKQPDKVYVRVDRCSPLGNPFIMKKESERNEVCDKFEKYFYNRIEDLEYSKDYDFKSMINYLLILSKTKDIVLLCWCAPKRCHAETIKKWLEEKLNV